MNQWLDEVFAIKGQRISRRPYALAIIKATALMFIWGFLFGAVFDGTEEFSSFGVGEALMIIATIGIIYITLYVYLLSSVRRLRDIGWNEYWALLLFIPYFSWLVILFFCFKKGKHH